MRFIALNQKPIPRGEEEYTFVMSSDGVDLSRIPKRAAYVDLHHDYDRIVGRITEGNVVPNERLEVDTELWRDTPEAKAYSERYEDGRMSKVSVEIGAMRRDVSSMGRGKKRVNRWSLLGMALTGHPADEDTGRIETDLSLKGDDKPLTGYPQDFRDFDMVFRLSLEDGENGEIDVIDNDWKATEYLLNQATPQEEEAMVSLNQVQELLEKSNKSLIAEATEAFTSVMAQNKEPEPSGEDTPKGPTFTQALDSMKKQPRYASHHPQLEDLAFDYEFQGKSVADFVQAAQQLTEAKADNEGGGGDSPTGAGSGDDGTNAEDQVVDELESQYSEALSLMLKQARYAGQGDPLGELAFDMRLSGKSVAEFVEASKTHAVAVNRVPNDRPRNNPGPALPRMTFELESINTDHEKGEARELLQDALNQFIRGNWPDGDNPFVRRSIEGQRVSKLGQAGFMLRREDMDIIDLTTKYGGTSGTDSVGDTATVVGPMFIRSDVPDPLNIMPYVQMLPSVPGETVLATVDVPTPGMIAEPGDAGYAKTGDAHTTAVKLTPHLLVERLNLTRVAELSQAGLTNFAIATAIMKMGEVQSGQVVAGSGASNQIGGVYSTASLMSSTVTSLAGITAAIIRAALARAKLGRNPLIVTHVDVIDALRDIASPTAAGKLVENEMVDGVMMLRTEHLSVTNTKKYRSVIAAFGEVYVKQWDNAYFVSRRYWGRSRGPQRGNDLGRCVPGPWLRRPNPPSLDSQLGAGWRRTSRPHRTNISRR